MRETETATDAGREIVVVDREHVATILATSRSEADAVVWSRVGP